MSNRYTIDKENYDQLLMHLSNASSIFHKEINKFRASQPIIPNMSKEDFEKEEVFENFYGEVHDAFLNLIKNFQG